MNLELPTEELFKLLTELGKEIGLIKGELEQCGNFDRFCGI